MYWMPGTRDTEMSKIVLALRELQRVPDWDEEGGMGLTGVNELDFGFGEFEM